MPMLRRLALALSALVIVLVLWGVRRAGTAAASATSLRPDASEVPDVDRPGPIARPPSSSAPAEAPSRDEAATVGRDRVAVPEPLSAVRRIAVDVVHEEQAVAEARVVYVASVGEEEKERFWDEDEVDTLLAERGSELFTDGDGRAELPLSEGTTLVAAFAAGLWRRGSFDAGDEEPWTLELERDVDLGVRVVDEAGRGVPRARVALRETSDGWTYAWRSREADDEGNVVLRHVGDQLGEEGMAVVIDAPLHPLVGHSLEAEDPPDETIVLVMPRTASVEVEVVEPDGTPFAGEGTLEAGVVAPGTPRALSVFGDGVRPFATAPLAELVRLPHVQPGAELCLRARRGRSEVFTEAFLHAPGAVGDVARTRLVLASDHPALSWRLVDPEGRALADRKIRVGTTLLVEQWSGWGERLSTQRTDEDGRLVLDLAPFTEPDERRRLDLTDTSADPPISATVLLGAPLTAGLHERGELQLVPTPLFVSGLVVGADGQPVSGARLQVQREEKWGWRLQWNRSQATGPDGRFEWNERVAEGNWRIRAEHATGKTPFVPFLVGQRNVTLGLLSPGAIEGEVLVDWPITEEHQLGVSLSDPDDRGLLHHSRLSAHVEPDRTFGFDELLPGTYQLRMSLPGLPEPLVAIDAVTVLAGETRKLAPLDLRGRLASFPVTLVPPEPDDDLGGRALSFSLEQPDRRTYHWFRGERFHVLSVEEAVRLVISVEGYRSETLERLDGPVTVALRPALEVRVLLRGDAPLPEPPRLLMVALAPDEGSAPESPPFDDRREVVCEVPAAGRLRVHWALEQSLADGSAWMRQVESEPPQYVEIADVPHEQIVEVRLDAAEYEELFGSSH